MELAPPKPSASSGWASVAQEEAANKIKALVLWFRGFNIDSGLNIYILEIFFKSGVKGMNLRRPHLS